jgi:hypothetical protein
MPAMLVGVSPWFHSSMVVLPPFFSFIDSHYGLMGGAVKLLIVWGVTVAAMRNHVVQLGVLVCRTAVP